MELELREIVSGYKGKDILHKVSLKARAGQVTAVIGANAVGKSTLIKTVVGALKPKSGQILLEGVDLSTLPFMERSKKIGYLIQEQVSDIRLTVFETVLLGRAANLSLRVPPEEVGRVERMLKSMEIEALSERFYGELSGGQRRMVSIAQTIVQEPRVLILDEPTANLDLQNEIEILKLVQLYTRQKGSITLVTLHDLNLAARFADHMVLLKGGAVYREGSPSVVLTPEAIGEAYGVLAEVDEGRDGSLRILIRDSLRERNVSF